MLNLLAMFNLGEPEHTAHSGKRDGRDAVFGTGHPLTRLALSISIEGIVNEFAHESRVAKFRKTSEVPA